MSILLVFVSGQANPHGANERSDTGWNLFYFEVFLSFRGCGGARSPLEKQAIDPAAT